MKRRVKLFIIYSRKFLSYFLVWGNDIDLKTVHRNESFEKTLKLSEKKQLAGHEDMSNLD